MKRFLTCDCLILLLGHLLLILAAFIEIFARRYEEFALTFLVAFACAFALALLAFFLKKRWLFLLSTLLLITGFVLLILFPCYVSYSGLIIGGLLLLGAISSILLAAKAKKSS